MTHTYTCKCIYYILNYCEYTVSLALRIVLTLSSSHCCSSVFSFMASGCNAFDGCESASVQHHDVFVVHMNKPEQRRDLNFKARQAQRALPLCVFFLPHKVTRVQVVRRINDRATLKEERVSLTHIWFGSALFRVQMRSERDAIHFCRFSCHHTYIDRVASDFPQR